MKIIERIVEAPGEPNANDLWLRNTPNGTPELLQYLGGEWVVIGGGSCGCDMSKIITTDDLSIRLNINKADMVSANDPNYPELLQLLIEDSNHEKTYPLLRSVVSAIPVTYTDDDYVCNTTAIRVDANRWGPGFINFDVTMDGDAGCALSVLYLDLGEAIRYMSEQQGLPEGMTIEDMETMLASQFGVTPDFAGWLVRWKPLEPDLG